MSLVNLSLVSSSCIAVSTLIPPAIAIFAEHVVILLHYNEKPPITRVYVGALPVAWHGKLGELRRDARILYDDREETI